MFFSDREFNPLVGLKAASETSVSGDGNHRKKSDGNHHFNECKSVFKVFLFFLFAHIEKEMR